MEFIYAGAGGGSFLIILIIITVAVFMVQLEKKRKMKEQLRLLNAVSRNKCALVSTVYYRVVISVL